MASNDLNNTLAPCSEARGQSQLSAARPENSGADRLQQASRAIVRDGFSDTMRRSRSSGESRIRIDPQAAGAARRALIMLASEDADRQGARLPHQRLTVSFGRMQWVIWPTDATREALHARSVRQRLGRSGNREGYSRGGWGRRRRRRWATPCRNFDSLPPWWGTGRGLGQDAWAGAGFWGVTCQAEAWHIMPADRPAPPLTGQGARGALDRPLYG